MINIFNILFAALAIMFLCHQLQAAHVSLVPAKEERDGGSATVVKDVKNYTDKHPNAKLKELSTRVFHYIGRRQEGDVAVFNIDGTYDYPLISEATSSASYPANTSLVITYAEIYFENTDGEVYVAEGGIGQNFISLVMVPHKTTGNFSTRGQVYGKVL